MTKVQKLLEKFKYSPQNVRFSEIKVLAESLGFVFVEAKASHLLCKKGEKVVMSFPIHNGDCLNVYKKKFRKIIS